MSAAAGVTKECPWHGQYIYTGAGCPVCGGRSSGITWSTQVGNAQARRAQKRRELNPDDDDPNIITSQPHVPELDRLWAGRE